MKVDTFHGILILSDSNSRVGTRNVTSATKRAVGHNVSMILAAALDGVPPFLSQHMAQVLVTSIEAVHVPSYPDTSAPMHWKLDLRPEGELARFCVCTRSISFADLRRALLCCRATLLAPWA